MTKSELIEKIASKQNHLPYRDIEVSVKTLLEQMSEALASGGRIEILKHKAGMAGAYGNLGIIYHIRGDIDQAEHVCKKSLLLFQAVTTSQVKRAQGLLDKLKLP